MGVRTPHGPLSPPLLLLGYILKFKGRTQRGEATLAPESTRKRLLGPQIWSKEETMRARMWLGPALLRRTRHRPPPRGSGRPGCDWRRLAASPAQVVGQPGVQGIAPAGTAESGASPARTDSLLPKRVPGSRPPGLSPNSGWVPRSWVPLCLALYLSRRDSMNSSPSSQDGRGGAWLCSVGKAGLRSPPVPLPGPSAAIPA